MGDVCQNLRYVLVNNQQSYLIPGGAQNKSVSGQKQSLSKLISKISFISPRRKTYILSQKIVCTYTKTPLKSSSSIMQQFMNVPCHTNQIIK